MLRVATVALLLVVTVACSVGVALAADAPPEIVRYEHDRLTVRATDVPLDRLMAEIAAVTHVAMRGTVAPRPVSIDCEGVSLSEGLTRILGAESFMLTYGSDGALRTIDVLARGSAPAPSPAVSPSPRPPLAAEQEQATILQRRVPVSGRLAAALGSDQPAIGRVLHAVLQERRPATRAAAREAALAAFARDPEIEAAYLSTLAPVDDAVLARVLGGPAAAGSLEEWMTALATRAPSAGLRAKAAAVLAALPR